MKRIFGSEGLKVLKFWEKSQSGRFLKVKTYLQKLRHFWGVSDCHSWDSFGK